MTTNLNITFGEAVLRLTVSLLIGIIIGLERELQHKSAGLRTSTLICVGATVYTIASLTFISPADPSRVAAQIVTGIGFLGAGTIIQMRGSVIGMTTAAAIWVMAALGLIVGLGHYTLALIATVLTFVVLNLFQYIEHAVKGKRTTCTYTLVLTDTGPALMRVMEALQHSLSEIKEVKTSREHDRYVVSFSYTDKDGEHSRLTEDLTKLPGVVEVTACQHT